MISLLRVVDSKDSSNHNAPDIAQLRVDLERIKRHILSLGEIGRNPADHGLYRMAFTDADMEAKRWLLDQIDGIS